MYDWVAVAKIEGDVCSNHDIDCCCDVFSAVLMVVYQLGVGVRVCRTVFSSE